MIISIDGYELRIIIDACCSSYLETRLIYVSQTSMCRSLMSDEVCPVL